MPKKISNFFISNMFECHNYRCICQKDIEYQIPGQPAETTLKMYCDPNEPLLFAYAPQKGLNLSGVAGAALESNILGKLLKIPDGDIDAHIAFFEKYGFLLPLESDEYVSVKADDVMNLVYHIKSTLRLMNAIAGERDYKAMLIHATYLLFSSPVSIDYSGGQYETCRHRFTDLIGTCCNFPDMNGNQEAFDTGKFTVSDTMCGSGTVDLSFYNAVRSSSNTTVNGSADSHFKNIVALYTSYPHEDSDLRTIIDFYYHFQLERGVLKDIRYRHISFYLKNESFVLSEEMKSALLKISRLVISEEINHNIAGIHPKYNSGELSPEWQLNNLLEAIYFSIFYMKPSVEIYRECENPSCKRDVYFLVNATATNKKYCCAECANAAAQRRYRSKKMQK